MTKIIRIISALNVGKSTMDKWSRQLKSERKGIPQKATAMTHQGA